ncbi:ThiF family adenylyltransferase [Actinotalea sp. K2]|uniref:ThiF family adenylyltransferase n=1 Tax=Actinotalea sp. K2 TaxID=2939438 RepID=UPI002016DC0C|nr:ThiF family adenylyltransferase [Actinotalea sp. K2]MCL3859852.1 ThiF family adenylyltransferase [Actinotalea sp. K2]
MKHTGSTTTARSAPEPGTTDPADVRLRLRPGLTVLWRSPTRVQIGTDPRWAVTLTDLSPSAARALRSLPSGADLRALRAAFRREAVPPTESDLLVTHLRTARLLVPPPSTAPAPSAGLEPDVTAWSMLSEGGDGAAVLRRRRSAVVRVVGLGRTGVGLAGLLAAAGIGTVELDDDRPVTPSDLGVGGYTTRDLHRPRQVAAGRVLQEVAPLVRTRTPRHGRVDLVVLVEAGAADPVRSHPLVADRVAHLSVVLREASTLVGPLVHPGRSACLRCVDLHRADGDTGWPTVGAQLASGTGRSSEESVLASVAAATAGAQALAVVDGREASALGGSFEITLPEALPRRRPWSPHPRCGCTGLSDES